MVSAPLILTLGCICVVPVVMHLLIRRRAVAVWWSLFLVPVVNLTGMLTCLRPFEPAYLVVSLATPFFAILPTLIVGRFTHPDDPERGVDSEGDPICRHCGYKLVGLAARRCPECGTSF